MPVNFNIFGKGKINLQNFSRLDSNIESKSSNNAFLIIIEIFYFRFFIFSI